MSEHSAEKDAGLYWWSITIHTSPHATSLSGPCVTPPGE